jgi:hypothetical protein
VHRRSSDRAHPRPGQNSWETEPWRPSGRVAMSGGKRMHRTCTGVSKRAWREGGLLGEKVLRRLGCV